MTKRERILSWCKENIVYIAGFFVPVMVMTFVCIVFGVAPFGDRSLAIIDALHQYMPFFAEYHDKIRNLDTFFYSWNGGLGYNFLALWAYYLSSPLNLIMVLFPKTLLNLAFGLILILKIGLIGLTTAVYLASLSDKHDGKIILFSTAFALSGFITGYSWNIMWLDPIIMLPLILLFFDRMMKKKESGGYVLCLALAMAGNFYIAFMICIFLVFWFCCYRHEAVAAFFKNGIRFAISSLVSAALAGVTLLPAYLGLMKTSSADAMDLPEHEWFTNLFRLLRTHLLGVEQITNDNFDGNANLYIGMIMLVLFLLYLMTKEISLAEKGKRILLLALFVVSFNEKVLNFIWHGFHNQYGIPNRFAFLYLFLIMLTGFEAMKHYEDVSVKRLIPAVVLSAAVPFLFEFGSGEEADVLVLALSVGAVLLYGMLLLLGKTGKIRTRLAVYLILFVGMAEIIGMAFYGFGCNGQISISKFYADTKAVEEVKKDLPKEELVRTCLVKAKMLDEDIWHGLKSVGIFGSTARGDAVSMMDHWGFYTAANEYLYKGATPLTNLLFNVGYQIRRGDDDNRHDFYIARTYEDMDLLENPYHTSIGYGVEGELTDWNYGTVYPFDVQNGFVREAYGMDDIFKEIDIPDPEIHDGTINRTNRSEFTFTYETSVEDNMVFTLPLKESGDLYIHYDGTRVENTIVKVDDEIRVNDEIDSEIYHIGLVEEDSEVKIYMEMKDDGLTSGVIRLSAALFDHEAFQHLYEKMMRTRIHVDSYDSNSIEGTVTLAEDGMVLFSIPHDEGWKVVLDGKETETIPVAEGMLAVKAGFGTHKIEMEYTSPGFYEGLFLTGLGAVCFLLLKKIDGAKVEKEDSGNSEESSGTDAQEVGL